MELDAGQERLAAKKRGRPVGSKSGRKIRYGIRRKA